MVDLARQAGPARHFAVIAAVALGASLLVAVLALTPHLRSGSLLAPGAETEPLPPVAAARDSRADAKALAQALGPRGEPILLGSIATRKYLDVLLAAFPQELLFPAEFVGRGDMSRGGLMLRSVDAHLELAYVLVRGAILRGARPPKLPPR